MQTLPGFRDFLPEDCAARNYIFAKWREVCARYGFVEWDGPILEPTELFTKKSGPEIVGQLFYFTDKGQREVTMRPELTPTLARVVAAHGREFRKPLKWFSIPQCFRYEKQQRGRLREHFQLNCDILGEESLGAEIELLALCIDLLRAFGLTSDEVMIRVSDREFWMEFLRGRNVPDERFAEILQIIDKSEREPRQKTADKLQELAEPIFAILDGGGESEKLNRLADGLAARGLGDFVKIDLSIVRGLAYYTGVVFEAFDRRKKFRAIAGGGRYDNLVAQLSDGAVAMPAIGFAMGDVVLGELLADHSLGKTEAGTADIYLVIAKEERRRDALAQLQLLRDKNLRVDYPLAPMKVGKQFQIAESLGAKFAVLFGEEWPQLKIKNLGTREEQLVPCEELLAHLAR